MSFGVGGKALLNQSPSIADYLEGDRCSEFGSPATVKIIAVRTGLSNKFLQRKNIIDNTC